MAALSLTSAHVDQMLAHARREAPDECCGILVGTRDGDTVQVTEIVGAANMWEGDRRDRFMLDPALHMHTQRACRERNVEIVGFYHSHPHAAPIPSRFDAEMAWSGHAYVIVSLDARTPGELRCWEWIDAPGEFMEWNIVHAFTE